MPLQVILSIYANEPPSQDNDENDDTHHRHVAYIASHDGYDAGNYVHLDHIHCSMIRRLLEPPAAGGWDGRKGRRRGGRPDKRPNPSRI
jgi:hypothetical protein